MDKETDQNLRIYSKQLSAQLRDKEDGFTDLQRKFSKLHDRFAQLDYAFRKNLQLHQQQMIEIHELRLSQKELRRVEKDRWKQLCKLEDQLIQITKEKEDTKNDLIYWKQAVIDQKIFYEGKVKECFKECEMRMSADATVHKRTLNETQSLAERQIKELINRCKLNEEEGEVIRTKAIMLQGDVDVSKYRMQELVNLIEKFQGINKKSDIIYRCIVKVLRAFNAPHDSYDNSIKELHRELLQFDSDSVVEPEKDVAGYEMVKSQNMVLREVVKKLKNELAKVQKSEAILSKQLIEENSQKDDLTKALTKLNLKNQKLCNSLVEKDTDLKQLSIESSKNIAKLDMSLEQIKSREIKEQSNFSKTNSDSDKCITASGRVDTEKRWVNYSENQEYRDFEDDKRQEAYWGLQVGRVKKFEEQTTGDMVKDLKLNLVPSNSGPNSGKNHVTLKDKQKVKDNAESYTNAEKNSFSKFNQGRLEPTESHLNSVRYKEYTISLSDNHNLKIRHPIAPGSTKKIFQFGSAYSEKEYQSMPIDETVFYFQSENGDPVFPKSKMTDDTVQTIPIPTANVFTQTTTSKDTCNKQTSTGVKILNSERRAIEKSLRDLEKTVSEAGQETLGLARSMITNGGKFPPSEEFFDCIKYLSQYGYP